jgi:hypothetical protein
MAGNLTSSFRAILAYLPIYKSYFLVAAEVGEAIKNGPNVQSREHG